MGDMKSYRDLEVYQLAHKVGVELHSFTLELPKYELFETGSQLRRASKSISANLVEGYGRRKYKADFIRFLIFSHASCNESIEWIEYIRDCHPSLSLKSKAFLVKLDKIGRKLNRFIQAVENGHRV